MTSIQRTRTTLPPVMPSTIAPIAPIASPPTPTTTPTTPTTTKDHYVGITSAAVVHGRVANPQLPPLQPRRLPDVEAALLDPTLSALSPSSIPVPDDVMAALRSAKRVLVIGHVPPDGDCVGTAAGLCAALKAAGKHAVAVVDDALPAASRAIAAGTVGRAADHAADHFDLVVVVDVAAAARIGGAAAFVAAADNVLVIDHHEGGPTREGLGMKTSATLTTWNDPRADAAAVLVAGVAARFGDDAFVAASKPLAAAMYTDTLGFKAPGAKLDTLRLFKGIVGDASSLSTLRTSLSPPLPPAVRAVLDAPNTIVGQHGAAVVVDGATWQQAQDTAKASDPAIVLQDLRGHLADRLDALRDHHGFAALVIDEGHGVRVSLRSIADGPAHDVATALGGGGHGRSAASYRKGEALSDTLALLKTATTTMQLARDAKLKSGRL